MPAVQGRDGETHSLNGDERREGNQQRAERDSDTATELSDDEIFDILRNSRRRAVISYLLQEEEQASVKELTKYTAAKEYEIAPEEVSPDQHKRVYTALCQCHLQRLEDFGVIDFEKDAKTVTLNKKATQIEPYLHLSNDRDAARIELAVAVIVASVVMLGVLQVGPFGYLSVRSWAVFVVLGLVGTVLVELFV